MPNTIGIRTKKGPSTKPAAYFNDSEYDSNINIIREDILNIKNEALSGKTIVFASGGYGTGLARLDDYAPKTFKYLNSQLKLHFHFDNETGKKWQKIPGHDDLVRGKYVSLDKENTQVVQPINNSYFCQDYLSKNINSTYELIKTENKVAFTSTNKYNIDEIIIFTFKDKKDYVVCRVIDSYGIEFVLDSQLWHKFEGYSKDFNPIQNNFNFERLFQTQFEFISTLDAEGNMIYKQGIFQEISDVNKSAKVVGEKIKNTMREDELLKLLKDLESRLENLENKKFFKNPLKKTFKELLKSKGILGDFQEIKNDTFSDSKKVFQVKYGDTFYAVKYNEGFFTNSIEIIMTAKNPFI